MRFDAVTGERTVLTHAEPSLGSPAWRPRPATAAAIAAAATASASAVAGETRSPGAPTSNGDIVLAASLPAIDWRTGALIGHLACTGCDDARRPAWSRDGTTLAFVDVAGSLKTWRDGEAGPRTLVACPGNRCPVEFPSWSPGGDAILFGAGGALYEIDTASLAIHAIPLPARRSNARPAGWTGGDRIAFMTVDNAAVPTQTIWIADSDGADASIVATDHDVFWASIAPSGDQIAAVRSPGNPAGVAPFNAVVQLVVYLDRRRGAAHPAHAPGLLSRRRLHRGRLMVAGRDDGARSSSPTTRTRPV